ncbi:hypothetical protein QBC47DRAFT_401810 [Echria macrotheca]|uniref:Uncharacterized protein n=1 Tax=Echria macrotheca TaxID=438768 RepID=A0AAJ0BEI3_9PEZI|nr:hypothetical protein QBC47DRAFT_401810 [Echria macrotheca]
MADLWLALSLTLTILVTVLILSCAAHVFRNNDRLRQQRPRGLSLPELPPELAGRSSRPGTTSTSGVPGAVVIPPAPGQKAPTTAAAESQTVTSTV